ncbi:mediator of RNA polymerase II transcription subunit 25, partial [Tanacetum coccineum]
LPCIEFSGSKFCDAAIAEGLAQALTIFPSPNGSQTQLDEGLRRHCILVAASNPDSQQLDAETVAKSFPQHQDIDPYFFLL